MSTKVRWTYMYLIAYYKILYKYFNIISNKTVWLKIENKLKKVKNSDFSDSVIKSIFWDVPTRSKLSIP